MSAALELARARHAEELVGALRKEAARAQLADHDDADKYRQLLVRALHRAALKFPDVAPAVAPALLELLADGGEPAALDVLLFLRHALHAFPQLRPAVYPRLLHAVASLRVGKVILTTTVLQTTRLKLNFLPSQTYLPLNLCSPRSITLFVTLSSRSPAYSLRQLCVKKIHFKN